MAYLDLAAAEEAIRRFNGYSPLPAADRLVSWHFPSPEAALEPATIAERVVLIDGVFPTTPSVAPWACRATRLNLLQTRQINQFGWGTVPRYRTPVRNGRDVRVTSGQKVPLRATWLSALNPLLFWNDHVSRHRGGRERLSGNLV